MKIPGANISFKDQRGSFGPQNAEMNIVIVIMAILAIVLFGLYSDKIESHALEKIAPQAECVKEQLLRSETKSTANKTDMPAGNIEDACKGQELFLKTSPIVIGGKALNLMKLKTPQEEVRISRDWRMSVSDGSVQVRQKKAISVSKVIGGILLLLPLLFAVSHIFISITDSYGCCLVTSIIWLLLTVVAYSMLFATGDVLSFKKGTITKEFSVIGKTGLFDPESYEKILAAAPLSFDDDSSRFTVFYMGREDEDDKEEKLLMQILFSVDKDKVSMLAPVLETFIMNTPAPTDDPREIKEEQPQSKGKKTGKIPAADKK